MGEKKCTSSPSWSWRSEASHNYTKNGHAQLLHKICCRGTGKNHNTTLTPRANLPKTPLHFRFLLLPQYWWCSFLASRIGLQPKSYWTYFRVKHHSPTPLLMARHKKGNPKTLSKLYQPSTQFTMQLHRKIIYPGSIAATTVGLRKNWKCAPTSDWSYLEPGDINSNWELGEWENR